jgi:peptidyl-prolyl cis-trans isomerase D
MLQKIGDKLQGQRWLAFVILGLLALIFAAWGAYGIVDFTMGSGSYAAKVNGEEISAAEVNRAWQDEQPQYVRLFNGEIPAAQRELLQNRLLDGFIRNKVVHQHATDLGYRVTDAQLARAFQAEPAFQQDGKFSAIVARARLAQAGISESAFIADQRRSLAMNQLAASIDGTDFLTPVEVARLNALQGEQRETRFALLTPQQFGAGPPPSSDAINAYYTAHVDQYQTTESVKLAYAELSLADAAAKVAVSDAQLRERYEATKDSYVEPERRHARHILLTVDKPGDDAKVKAEADALYAEASSGKDFAALAKAHSKDPGTAAQGGDLGWSDRNAFVPAFADTLFGLKEGEISKPVKTQYGYHIIKLEGIQAGKSRSFEEARAELEAQLKKDYAADKFGEAQEQLQQRVDRGTGNFDELVKEFGLKTGEVQTYERGRGGEPLGADAALNALVFGDKGLNQRVVVGPAALGEERLVIARVLDHRPATAKPLAEVRDAIVAELIRQRGVEAARTAAQGALTRLAAGESFDKVMADLKVKSDAARFVGRATTDLPVQVRKAVFTGARPVAGKPVLKVVPLDEGGTAVVAVTAVRSSAEGEDPQTQAIRLQTEMRRQGLVETDAYMAELVRAAKIHKNLKVFQ